MVHRKGRLRRMTPRLSVCLSLVVVVALSLVHGCAFFVPLPEPTTVAERVAQFPTRDLPLRGRVTVHWDKHLIPFIEAERDDDLAVALGLVHAHLRLGQITLFKRVAQGRLAEMFGPPAVDVDRSLRILDVGRAAPDIYRGLPAETRRWLDGFVRGLNAYQDRLTELPHEFRVCGIEPEPWTGEDIITIARLGSVDVNWMTWFLLLPVRGKPYYGELLGKFLDAGAKSVPSLGERADVAALCELLGGLSRSGSNSLAVAASRSASGGALLANDPHLGIFIPNTWLVVGFRSPSYQAVGMMPPGIPLVALGRGRHVAWGGTNMRAASSDLYDISGEPPESLSAHTERIRVRWWFDTEVTVRRSRLGPVVSDIPFFSKSGCPPLALRWVGHEPTDEFTAVLRGMRARNVTEFRRAFQSYGVSGMNLLAADTRGDIVQFLALKLPVRAARRPDDIVLDPSRPEHRWRGFKGSADFPFAQTPRQGVLASANNVPVKTSPPVGFFFSSSDRFRRMTALLRGAGNVSLEDIQRIQADVYSITDVAVRDAIRRQVEECGLRRELAGRHSRLLAEFEGWDGRYGADSVGAVAFQAVLYHLATLYYSGQRDEAYRALMLRTSYAREFLSEELRGAKPAALREVLPEAFARAAAAFERFPSWGAMHRLRVAHPLSNMPVGGSKYVFGDHPARGANATLEKTAHGLSAGRTTARYGSNARHISDLSDPDANYFVLLGGQDGWLRSAASLDQVPLWRGHRYVRVPLRSETVRRTFAYHVKLEGAGR